MPDVIDGCKGMRSGKGFVADYRGDLEFSAPSSGCATPAWPPRPKIRADDILDARYTRLFRQSGKYRIRERTRGRGRSDAELVTARCHQAEPHQTDLLARGPAWPLSFCAYAEFIFGYGHVIKLAIVSAMRRKS